MYNSYLARLERSLRRTILIVFTMILEETTQTITIDNSDNSRKKEIDDN